MRDRSKAHNYSASRDEFRRDHERRRAWGLKQRHAERLRQVHERQAGSFPADLQMPWDTVDASQSTARPTTTARRPTRACDPQAGRGAQAGLAKQPKHTSEPRRQPQNTPPARPNARRSRTTATAHASPHPANKMSGHRAPAAGRAGVTTPHANTRPPHPDPASKRQTQTRPSRARPDRARPGQAGAGQTGAGQTGLTRKTRHVHELAGGNNPTTGAPSGKQPNASREIYPIPAKAPRRYCQQISH